MYIVYEDNCGSKTAVAVANSESDAWMKCRNLNSVFKAAKGIRYAYERYV